MRLIDADALKATIGKYEFNSPNKYYKHGGECVLNFYMPKIIDDAPTIDAQPVRHGKWIYTALCDCNLSTVKCSRCDYECTTTADIAVEISDFNYCPSYGARMDGGDEYVK